MTYRVSISIFLFVLVLGFTGTAIAQDSMPDMDWQFGTEPIHSQGTDKPADGKLWGIAARKDNVQITFRLEVNDDLSAGRWVGDIRAPEKFYAKFRLMSDDRNQVYFQVENAKAIGPDAQNGQWKDGPGTRSFKSMSFDFNWDQAQKIRGNKTLILNYASADTPDIKKDIHFPLDNFDAKLTDMEAAIRAVPGADKYLLTEIQIKTMPIKNLPPEMQAALSKELDGAAKFLNRSKSDLMKLNFHQVEALIKAERQAKGDAKLAAKRAEHQKIYDQEPNWKDLNVCPKRDVPECGNIGRGGYEFDTMMGKDWDYGKIIGVVWRSEGSIIHIFGGNARMDIDPEIVRAKSAKYYYTLEKDGKIELRPASLIKVR